MSPFVFDFRSTIPGTAVYAATGNKLKQSVCRSGDVVDVLRWPMTDRGICGSRFHFSDQPEYASKVSYPSGHMWEEPKP